MKLDTALDEFGLLQRRRHRGEQGRENTAALAAVREFLLDYSGFEETEAIRPSDFYTFLLEYYPSEEEPSVEVASALLEVTTAFATWLIERGERGLAPFVAASERLRDDVPRVLEARDLLQEHARREDLEPPSALLDEEEERQVGAIGTGVNRVARLDQIDYAAAQEEYFSVVRVQPGELELQSRSREALQEPPLAPVVVTEAASERLRPGDTIHAEVAPGPQGWELLEVFGIRPGGYA